MATLYELTGQFLEMLQILRDADVDEETIDSVIASSDVNCDIDRKAEGYCKVIKNIEHDINLIVDEMKRLDEEKARLDTRMTIFENRIIRMKKALQNSMELTGKRKIETELFTIGIQKNGGKRPMDITAKVDDLPEDFRIKVPDKINKDAVRAYIEKNGILNSDGDLISEFGIIYHQSESLRIR